MTGTLTDPEDAKLVTLARAARARASARQGAAVRDADGRTYAAVGVSLPALQLSALQVAVAMAVSSGAGELIVALVLGDDSEDAPGVAAVRDVSPTASVFYADAAGRVRS